MIGKPAPCLILPEAYSVPADTKCPFGLSNTMRYFLLRKCAFGPCWQAQECEMSAKRGETFPFEVCWRSINLLFVDMATSESLFCADYFG